MPSNEPRDNDGRLAEYRAQGYTIFEGAYDEPLMQSWREEHQHPRGEGPFIERASDLFWPAIANPLILDFAERVVGPFVQLDNFTFAASPPVEPEEGEGCFWHRDRWAHMPNGVYEPPLAMNAISYLQDLTNESGPLRVIPGSHVKSVRIDLDQGNKPHKDEVILHLNAGDVVLTHNCLLHSGTQNTSGKLRFFFSIYYNITWLQHTDSFEGPTCHRLIEEARQRNNRRALRLLGVDEQRPERSNSLFRLPDEVRWQEWLEEDRKALKEGAES